MKTVIWLLIIIVTVIIQSTLIPVIMFNGICPDMLMVVVVSYALLSGKEKGIGIGFFAGLVQDLAFGNIFGINTLAKMTIGYIFGLAERKVFKEKILLPIAATAVATLLHSLAIFVVLFLLGNKVDILTAITNNVVPLVGYNVILAIPIHHIVYKITTFSTE